MPPDPEQLCKRAPEIPLRLTSSNTAPSLWYSGFFRTASPSSIGWGVNLERKVENLVQLRERETNFRGLWLGPLVTLDLGLTALSSSHPPRSKNALRARLIESPTTSRPEYGSACIEAGILYASDALAPDRTSASLHGQHRQLLRASYSFVLHCDETSFLEPPYSGGLIPSMTSSTQALNIFPIATEKRVVEVTLFGWRTGFPSLETSRNTQFHRFSCAYSYAEYSPSITVTLNKTYNTPLKLRTEGKSGEASIQISGVFLVTGIRGDRRKYIMERELGGHIAVTVLNPDLQGEGTASWRNLSTTQIICEGLSTNKEAQPSVNRKSQILFTSWKDELVVRPREEGEPGSE
ncbi:hypothetical protein NMY22_g15861 [Coprinellus aureogranulatus]|nr:hypothetical protein NMY22_g15861 [Coprinellus aureogranulatus]